MMVTTSLLTKLCIWLGLEIEIMPCRLVLLHKEDPECMRAPHHADKFTLLARGSSAAT